MNKVSTLSKLKWITCSCFIILAAYLTLGFTGVIPNLNSNLLGIALNNSHTGLVTPPAQHIALNDSNKTEQYANRTNNTVAVGNMPTVLFDISAQPVIEETDPMILGLLSTIAGVLSLAAIYSVSFLLKRSRMKKIKEIKQTK